MPARRLLGEERASGGRRGRADKRGEDDHVDLVVTRRLVEGAAARDEAQACVVKVAVDERRGKGVLGILADLGDPEDGDAPVFARDVDLVPDDDGVEQEENARKRR